MSAFAAIPDTFKDNVQEPVIMAPFGEEIGKSAAAIPLSHHLSLARAIENRGSVSAAEPLARLLQKPGMSGHAVLDIEDAMTGMANNGKGDQKKGSLQKRSRAIREITLARALYHCGDHEGLGEEIL